MRLRYLHLLDFPPLYDVEITFGHEALLGHPLAIRFIVGVNGTGKTRLLQALTETFLSLAQQRVPPFAITLAYDLGTDGDRRTIYLHRPQEQAASEAVLIEYDEVLPDDTVWQTPPEAPERNRFSGDALPGTGTMEAFLPTPLLVYTSGSTDTWQALFTRQIPWITDVLTSINSAEDATVERPLFWDAQREREYLIRSDQIEQAQQIRIPDPDMLASDAIASRAAVFVTTEQLKLAACAVTLDQAIQEWATPDEQPCPNPDLRDLLKEVQWEAPLSVMMDIDFRLDRLTSPQAERLLKLIQLATVVHREPEPGTGRSLVFDLPQRVSEGDITVAEELFGILGGENPTPFDVFRTLYDWQQSGLLRNLNLVVRKSGIKDVLLYDWLSDGERMFLGRIALFYLLKGQHNALLILDEPETHFNDIWKRRLVDILDDALGDLTSDVIISTHSSIALTDVFQPEITVLRQIPGTEKIRAFPPDKPTFGASPNEIMRDIFDANDAVGQRASEYLRLVLFIAARPDEVEVLWEETTTDDEMLKHDAFTRLVDFLCEETQYTAFNYGEKSQIRPLLLETLKSLKVFIQQQGITEIDLLQALLALEEKLGTSHYEFEFSRRIRALEARKKHALQG